MKWMKKLYNLPIKRMEDAMVLFIMKPSKINLAILQLENLLIEYHISFHMEDQKSPDYVIIRMVWNGIKSH